MVFINLEQVFSILTRGIVNEFKEKRGYNGAWKNNV